jgi:hypothetical protein
MKPGIDAILPSLAVTMAFKIIPALPEASYALGDARITAALLLLIAQQAEKGVDILYQENRRLRALFKSAAALDLPAALAKRLVTAAATSDEDLRLSAMEAANAGLATLLIDLQTEIEACQDAAAKAVNREIWALLVTGAEARMLELPPV